MLYCVIRQGNVSLNGALIGGLIFSYLCLHGVVILRQGVKSETSVCLMMLLLINALALVIYLFIFHCHVVTAVILFMCLDTILE